ncbi:MAG: hypothetical protein LH471_03135 [Salinibacterium sp.]|nr:hypothetical protein [Salinibacterium sp.]
MPQHYRGVRHMKQYWFLITVVTTTLALAVPFVGGGGFTATALGGEASNAPVLGAVLSAEPVVAQPRAAIASLTRLEESVYLARAKAHADSAKTEAEQLGQKPVSEPLPPVNASGAASDTDERPAAQEAAGLSCPGPGGGATSGAPGAYSAQGVAGTTSEDLASFAAEFNAIRLANCLEPIQYFFYDSCMEARLFWMAESPSPDPLDAWGHMGSVRIDGAPSVGCDGNLAGGSGNSGATVASKWWESASHRSSLYRPDSGAGGACIAFAMTHGGIDEPYSFTRAAANWTNC